MAGLRLLCDARDELRETGFIQRNRELLGRLAEGFGHAGKAAQGLMVMEEEFMRSEHDEEHVYMAEQLRIKGELLMLEGAPGAAVASEHHFRQALASARRQGALSWNCVPLLALSGCGEISTASGSRRFTGAGIRPFYRRFRDGRPARSETAFRAADVSWSLAAASGQRRLPWAAFVIHRGPR